MFDKSRIGLIFKTPRASREVQDSALREAGASWIVEIGQIARTWRMAVTAVREGDLVFIYALSLVPTKRGQDELSPSAQVADFLVEVETDEHVRSIAPDFEALKQVDARGVIVTARGVGRFDFVSRFFAPRVGIREDPVTGSAHCALGPYWSAKLGRAELSGYQASRRGGVVRTTIVGERVKLGGRAVTVMRGELA